jgi:hypothetical protein
VAWSFFSGLDDFFITTFIGLLIFKYVYILLMPTNKQKYNSKYGFSKDESHSKKDISKKTGIPMRILDEVYDRGLAAHRGNPESVRSATTGKKVGGKSLRGKMSAQQWSMGRIYSFIMKQPGTWGRADRDLADKVKKLKIKGYTR